MKWLYRRRSAGEGCWGRGALVGVVLGAVIYLTMTFSKATKTTGCSPRGSRTSLTLGIPKGPTIRCPLALDGLSSDCFSCR